MKAAQINKYGEPEVLEINDIPEPTPGKGYILIKNHAASINPFDVKLQAGMFQKFIPLQFPATLGGDFAGVVTKVGEDVSEYAVGDEVYGQAIILAGGSGTFAEFVNAKTGNISRKPENINFEEAGAMPLVGSSAIQAIEEHIKLQSGQRVLIHGGAGGIGSIAIQVAKALGAYVATTAGTQDIEYVKQLGADEVIDFKTQKFEELLKDFDAVYDTVGGETTEKSFTVLKKGGVIVSMLGQPNPELSRKYGVTAIGQNTQTTTARLQRLTQLVESGAIKPQIAKVFPLEKIKEAFTYQEQSHPRGKVVIEVKE